MVEVIMIDKETYTFVKNTLKQCQEWLRTDAAFSHSNAKVRMVNENVSNSLSLLYKDLDAFKDNNKIINEMIKEKNKESEIVK